MVQPRSSHRYEYQVDQSSAIRVIVMRTYLHITDRNTVSFTVPYDFILNLLPSFHTLLNQHLRTIGERLDTQLPQILFVVCKSTSQSPKSVRRTNNNWIPNTLHSRQRLIEIRCRGRLGTFLFNLSHRLRKKFA